MRTSEEVLAFVNEQLWYLESIAKEEGLKTPVLAKIEIKPTQVSLEQKYWLYQNLKWFIQEEI